MSNSKEYLTIHELAERWKMSPRTLNNWRYAGKGLPYTKMSNKVILYDVTDVKNYEQKHRVAVTVA